MGDGGAGGDSTLRRGCRLTARHGFTERLRPFVTVRSARGKKRSVGHPPSSASHTTSVLPLIHQRGGGSPRTGAAEGALRAAKSLCAAWPTGHIVPITTGLGLRSARFPMEVEVGALVGCLSAIKANPSGVRDHGFTEQLRPFSAKESQQNPFCSGGRNGGYLRGYDPVTYLL